MKKLIAILLTFTVVFTFGIPAFASDAETESPQITEEEILDIIQSDEFEDALEEEGIDVEEFEENIENGDYEIIDDDYEMTYEDKLLYVVSLSDELLVLSFGSGALGGILGVVSPGLILVTIPVGIILFVCGVGTIVTSPVIALVAPDSFFDR